MYACPTATTRATNHTRLYRPDYPLFLTGLFPFGSPVRYSDLVAVGPSAPVSYIQLTADGHSIISFFGGLVRGCSVVPSYPPRGVGGVGRLQRKAEAVRTRMMKLGLPMDPMTSLALEVPVPQAYLYLTRVE